MLMVGAQSGHEGDGDPGERVVDDQRGGGGKVEARVEELVHGFAVGAGLRFEGAMATYKVVAECELVLPGIGVADGVDVARDNGLERPKRPQNPAVGLLAGTDKVSSLGDVVAAGHLSVGNQEMDALTGPCNPGRRAGPAPGVVGEAALGAELRGLGARNRVKIELALGGDAHVPPGDETETAVVEVGRRAPRGASARAHPGPCSGYLAGTW